MTNYTHKTIKAITIASILTITNLNAFSLFGTTKAMTPKECYVYNKGKLNFLNVLANQSMYVKTGEQIEELLNKMNMKGNNAKFFIKGRKDMVSELLEVRYRRSSPIPKSYLFQVIDQVKIESKRCFKQNHQTTTKRGF